MPKGVLLAVVLFTIVLVAATSRSDSPTRPPPSLPQAAAAEPISGTPAVSAAGPTARGHEPFTSYEAGPPGTKTWTPSDLPPGERAARTADPAQTAHVASAFAAAAAERAHQAAGESAAHQLGIVDDLGATGVVP